MEKKKEITIEEFLEKMVGTPLDEETMDGRGDDEDKETNEETNKKE